MFNTSRGGARRPAGRRWPLALSILLDHADNSGGSIANSFSRWTHVAASNCSG